MTYGRLWGRLYQYKTPLTLCVDRASYSIDFSHFTNQTMTKLFIVILITALALNNFALGAPASYSSSIRGTKSILEGDLQNHRLKPQSNHAVVPELYARDPLFGGIFRGIKKAVGVVKKVVGTARKIVGTARKIIGTAKQIVSTASKFAPPVGKIAKFLPRELEEVSEREYLDELFGRELDDYIFEREYDEELVRDFNDAAMDGLD
ncbi:hypothetical protein K443DRAFT_674343 [Laccaria amethystina LaAM-08-1]|uniref:Uncharacterized protein n=1 Tax=Laccaria amethystina LaAM-08-1 TaxID=1095629 RepID=A0A0C9X2J9_9AGAR|nr:hypothetical protein K443DRAFT_674343 [Laccaria amethystina LaAM-08-1]